MVQNTSNVHPRTIHEASLQQGDFQEHAPNEATLLNWQGEEFCGINQTYSLIVANTRVKKRVTDLRQPADKTPFHASQVNQGAVGSSTTTSVQMLQRNQAVANKEQPRIQSQPTQAKGDTVVPKRQQKATIVPFNVLENMKKVNVSMSVWDSLSIPGEKDLMQAALFDLSISNEPSKEQSKVVLTNKPQPSNEQQAKEVKPPPFYVSLIIGNDLVHNCMINSGASSPVMPNKLLISWVLNISHLRKK